MDVGVEALLVKNLVRLAVLTPALVVSWLAFAEVIVLSALILVTLGAMAASLISRGRLGQVG